MKALFIFTIPFCFSLGACQSSPKETNPKMMGAMCTGERPCASGMMGRGGRGVGRMNRPTFNEVDKESDGKITADELNEFRAQRMAERAQEGRRMKNAGQAPDFKDLDKNSDGSLSPDEFPPAMPMRK